MQCLATSFIVQTQGFRNLHITVLEDYNEGGIGVGQLTSKKRDVIYM